MNVQHNEHLASVGASLTIEERTSLESSLQILKESQSFRLVQFWGKLQALQRDYYIAVCTGQDLIKDRSFFISFEGCQWMQLPIIGQDEKNVAANINQRLTGDPAFEYTLSIPSADGSTTTNAAITEEKRVSYIVQQIDHDSTMVPRGAIYKNALNFFLPNPSFKGLDAAESRKLNYYYHLRPSDGFASRAQFEPEQVINSFDNFDPAVQDSPKGVWSLRENSGGKTVVLRHLKWPGTVSFCQPGSNIYGSVYLGTGLPNREIGFSL